MRRRVLAGSVAALAIVGQLLLQTTPPASANGTSGEFIVNCFYNGVSHRADPIISPGVISAHRHDFFGNATVTKDSTIASMEAATPSQTACQDTHDTAGYWIPTLYDGGKLAHIDGNHDGQFNAAGQDYHIRAYYIGSLQTDTLPKGLVMVNGYPSGCAVASPTKICDPTDTFPEDQANVFYDCGENQGITIDTPESYWPYDCSPYRVDNAIPPGGTKPQTFHPNGMVLHIQFPTCWNGNQSFVAPNSGGAQHVAHYISPNANPTLAASNDLAFKKADGTCPTGFTAARIPKIVIKVLTMIQDPCDGATPCGPSGCGHWPANTPGFTTCTPQDTPGPIAVGFSMRDPSGSGGTVIGPWWTFHADYWNTWQQGRPALLDTGAGGADPPRQIGTLADGLEDCVKANVTCGFISDTHPPPG